MPTAFEDAKESDNGANLLHSQGSARHKSQCEFDIDAESDPVVRIVCTFHFAFDVNTIQYFVCLTKEILYKVVVREAN